MMQCYYSELEFFGRKTFLSVHFSMVTVSNPTCNLTLELKSTTQAPIIACLNELVSPPNVIQQVFKFTVKTMSSQLNLHDFKVVIEKAWFETI
jgi:hypothetical protein